MILTLFSAFSCNSLPNQASGLNSIDIMKELLGDAFSYENKDGKAYLYYCPDNTCVSFIGKSSDIDELSDFSLLYLYHLSSYVYLSRDMHGNGIFIDEAKEGVVEIESEYAKSCSVEIVERLSCIMWGFIENYKFDVRSIRFDEGRKVFTSVNLHEKITKDNIVKIINSR